jgi:uncharacterized protein (TIGR03643 family)
MRRRDPNGCKPWEERTALEAIEARFGLNASAVITLMHRYLLPSSFRMWRRRTVERRTQHAAEKS